MTKIRRLVVGLAVVGLLAGASVLNDHLRHRRIVVQPSRPGGLDVKVYHDLRDAERGTPVDWSNLKDTLAYLDDFWMAALIRVVYRHGEKTDRPSP